MEYRKGDVVSFRLPDCIDRIGTVVEVGPDDGLGSDELIVTVNLGSTRVSPLVQESEILRRYPRNASPDEVASFLVG